MRIRIGLDNAHKNREREYCENHRNHHATDGRDERFNDVILAFSLLHVFERPVTRPVLLDFFPDATKLDVNGHGQGSFRF